MKDDQPTVSTGDGPPLTWQDYPLLCGEMAALLRVVLDDPGVARNPTWRRVAGEVLKKEGR